MTHLPHSSFFTCHRRGLAGIGLEVTCYAQWPLWGSPEEVIQEGIEVPSTISTKMCGQPREAEMEGTPHEELGDAHSGPGLSLTRWETCGRPLKPQWPCAFSSLTLDGETDRKPQIDEFSCPFSLTGNCCLEQCGGSQCQLSEKGQSAVDVRHLCGLVAVAPMPGII